MLRTFKLINLTDENFEKLLEFSHTLKQDKPILGSVEIQLESTINNNDD